MAIDPVKLQAAIDDMTGPKAVVRSNGSTQGTYHAIYVSGYHSVKASLDPYPTQLPFHDQMDCVVHWIWIWEGAGNTATNTWVQVSPVNTWLLLDSYTGTWNHYIQNTPIGDVHNNILQDADERAVEHTYSGNTVLVRPGTYLGKYTAAELWIQGFNGPLNATLMKRVRGLYAEIQARLILKNPSGTDDRANAKYWVTIGYDFYSRANQLAGIIGHPFGGSGGWPKHGYPGGYGRYELVTNDWKTMSVSPLESSSVAGSFSPFGSSGTPWPYQFPDWTMSISAFSANPPPPIYTDGVPPASSDLPTVTINGLNVDSLVQAAAAQPSGQQKAKYAADLSAALGANPVFEIKVGSTVVYRSTVVGSLSSSSNGLLLPTEFVEPPSVNVANALTDSAAVISIRNASNANVNFTVPVKAGGADEFLTASAALDGTKIVRTNAVLLKPPTTLN